MARLTHHGITVRQEGSIINALNPNETELKIESLMDLYTSLKIKNTAIANSSLPLKNARFVRNDIISKPKSGLVDIALDTKAYIKSIFGVTSPQYKQIAKLHFKAVPM